MWEAIKTLVELAQHLFYGINLANIISALIAVLGYRLAYDWLNNKKKNDMYHASKEYLSVWHEAEDILVAMSYRYSFLCPAPGLISPSEDFANKTIEELKSLNSNLLIVILNLDRSRKEMIFWKADLSNSFNDKHDHLKRHLREIGKITLCLNSQLYHMYVEGADNVQEVVRERKILDKELQLAQSLFDERLSLGFENIFKFKL